MPGKATLALWAPMIALAGCWCMCSICDTNLKAQPYSTSFYKLTFVVIGALAGGVVAFFYDKTPSPASPTSIGIFALIAGFFGVLFWWPCKFMGGMMLLFHYNYYVSGIVMIGLAIGCFLSVPTFLAGLAWLSSGIVFFIAAARGEKSLTIAQLTGGARAG